MVKSEKRRRGGAERGRPFRRFVAKRGRRGKACAALAKKQSGAAREGRRRWEGERGIGAPDRAAPLVGGTKERWGSSGAGPVASRLDWVNRPDG